MHSAEYYEKRDIKKYLDSIEAWYCLPATYGYGKSGAPDIIACLRGCLIGIEVKREGKELTKIQDRRMREIKDAGGLAFWGTAEKVIKELKEICE